MQLGKRLLAIPDNCSGCNRCVLACSSVKEGSFTPSLARIHVNNFPLKGYSVPSVCFQCPKPECMEACPEKAIDINEVGVVTVNEDKCDGCGDCVAACPYGMIAKSAAGVAYKCDQCGGDPACVKECHYGALVYVDLDNDQRRIRGLQMKQRSAEGLGEAKRHALGVGVMAQSRP
jgi:carbon-monoxide dehydrogenase iron sulfur subunit